MTKTKNILLTGAFGFLGTYIRHTVPAERVLTLGRTQGDILCDLGADIPRIPSLVETVIHVAGKAHTIPKNEREANLFDQVNVEGTEHLLKGLEQLTEKPKSFIFISSVAVYGLEQGADIDETFPLHGTTPYALSKIKAEQRIRDWGKKHGIKVLILRLPLLVGANPPGNLGAMKHALQKGYYFRFGKGDSRKSMVRAEDVALFIRENLQAEGIYNLTDGVHPSLYELEEVMARQYGKRIKTLPVWMVKMLAKTGDVIPFFPINTLKLHKLSHTLTFKDQKARAELGWNPSSVLEDFD